MGNKLKATHHLDRDPNDPRNLVKAESGFSLNDEPKAEVQEVEVVVTENERTTTPDSLRSQPWAKDETVVDVTRVGVDPNDSRNFANAEKERSLNKDEPEGW